MDARARRRWLRAAAALVLIGGSFLSAVLSPSSHEAAWRPTEVAARAAPTETLPGPGNAAVAAAEQVAATKPHGADEVELCGGLWLKLDPNGWPDETELSNLTQEPKARARSRPHALEPERAGAHRRAGALQLR